jgi:hypothetical protein
MANKRDPWNARAKALYANLKDEGFRGITTNVVVYEACEALRRWRGQEAAVQLWETIAGIARNPQVLEIVYADAHLEDEAFEILVKLLDQELSFTDCLSFAAMRRLGIDTAFSRDWHYTLLGFQIVPN